MQTSYHGGTITVYPDASYWGLLTSHCMEISREPLLHNLAKALAGRDSANSQSMNSHQSTLIPLEACDARTRLRRYSRRAPRLFAGEPTRRLAQYLSPQTILIWDGPLAATATRNWRLETRVQGYGFIAGLAAFVSFVFFVFKLA
jgi:hypothetical protein